MGRGKEIDGPVRNDNPCRNCTERFIACADHCPKDERGEYGYKAWKAEIERVNQNRRDYAKNREIGMEYTKKKGWKNAKR
jgi:hypothetical protein